MVLEPKWSPKGPQRAPQIIENLQKCSPGPLRRHSENAVWKKLAPGTSRDLKKYSFTVVKHTFSTSHPSSKSDQNWSILEAFGPHLAPKIGEGHKKSPSKNTSKKHFPKSASRCQNRAILDSNPDQIQTIFGTIFPPWANLPPEELPGPILA